MRKQTVSATSGTPEEIAAGIVPNYDRYVTHYKSKSKPFNPVEGMGVFVDVEPELDETGNLVMEEDVYKRQTLCRTDWNGYLGQTRNSKAIE